jgi:nitrate reductase NapAB chaperone NapD
MTVQSYLVYPEAGHLEAVLRSLAETPSCEVMQSENRDLLILITESDSAEAQRTLEARIEGLPGIECLALVSGWTE